MDLSDGQPKRKAVLKSSTPSFQLSNAENTASCQHIPGTNRGQAQVTSPRMADPFEVRMKFSSSLQQMNASVTSAQKAAHYAMKYRDMDEDLHSCILEQLEKNSMNNRANIMYFLEHLCDMAAREGHPDYIRMMQRDILRIVDAVAPEDGSGAANVKVVRKVLQGLQQKNFLLTQTVLEIEECLKERDAMQYHMGLSSPLRDNVDMTGTGSTLTPARSSKSMTAPRLDKKLVEQRIEEDRERHKRLREHQWAIADNEEDAEFDQMWDETSSVNSDDYRVFEEEATQRAQCATEHAEDMEVIFSNHNVE